MTTIETTITTHPGAVRTVPKAVVIAIGLGLAIAVVLAIAANATAAVWDASGGELWAPGAIDGAYINSNQGAV